MSDPISERLAEIEARSDAATPPPWTYSDRYPHVAWQGDESSDFIVGTNLSERPAEDIRFVAHARVDVPALVAAVRAAVRFHEPVETANGVKVCPRCSRAAGSAVRSPCEEKQAIAAALGERVNVRG